MELILQQNLPHQQEAVNAVCDVFEDAFIMLPKQFYENPSFSPRDGHIIGNIREIQKKLPKEYRSEYRSGAADSKEYLGLDVKMETGTGKTYVYAKTIFELHKRYGFNKFIIAVPSLTIKAGTEQFLNEPYARRHFEDSCGYGAQIEALTLKAPKNRKKGRLYFPSAVSEFIRGSCQNTKKIYVLLANMQLLTNAKLLTRDDYDYEVEGFNRPIDAIAATKPIVIIDEPHRFSRDQKAFKVIMEQIKPQAIIRYGATFPERAIGKKGTTNVRDYNNLLYDLNACAAFNKGLIKGVAKEHFEPLSRKEEKVKIVGIDSRDAVRFQYRKRDEAPKSYTLKTGDSLSIISNAFEGVTVEAIGRSSVEFSNGITKTSGEELDVDIYMTSYQEQMLRLALQRHFETEKVNFCNRKYKIKTLALFFIDDITSYRTDDDGKCPYLLEAFERLLGEQIERTLSILDDEHDAEYRKYLEASLADLGACHAGYFSQDNSDSDEDIAKEVDTILHGKKELISFEDSAGKPNTLRFLFSKWTLKEGWDNPNVFTIAKLRSSGSDNSKLQEVGRGLRLPVDENGNRISNEEFLLNYIVDFTEADFAQKLVDQINAEVPQASFITEERLKAAAGKLKITPDELFDELYSKRYIDRHMEIKAETRDKLFDEYPDLVSGLKSGKVRDLNGEKPKPVKIRKAAYDELKELWETINHRYLLFYDDELNDCIEDVALSIFEKPSVFADLVMRSERERVGSDGERMSVLNETGVQYALRRIIPYNVFLKRISAATSLPIRTLHTALCRYAKKHGMEFKNYINDSAVAAFCSEFAAWKNENLQGRFRYVRSASPVGATALTYADGTVRGEIAQGRIGTRIVPGTPSAKYLYDAYAYDSPLEKENIMADIEEVVVYGKIPRSSIAIPTVTGGMYSPDFMYVVKKKNGDKELNIIVETKDVEGKNDLRGSEKAKIECARVFFDMLTADGYKVYFRDQLGNRQMLQIINEIMGIDR